MNGVPWWFCIGRAEVGVAPLATVDPGGRIAERIAYRRVLGCVVHASCSVGEPGLVLHAGGQRLIIGEPGGGAVAPASERVRAVAALLRGGGFEVEESADVRREVWYKLWGNMTMNPLSALTGATLDRLLADPLVRDWCSQAMREAAAVGARIGCPIEQSPEDRHAITAKLGAIKTSMLQDVQAGRALELDAIVGAVHEIGKRVGVPTPQIDALFGLARLFARERGLYPQAVPAAAA
jgi:2-dehydropantoate 2-reductase